MLLPIGTAQFMSAATAGMSASNMSAMTFGMFSSNGSAIGVLICATDRLVVVDDHAVASQLPPVRLRPGERMHCQGAACIF